MADELILTAGPDFDFTSAEYCALFQRAGASPFQHPDWLGPLYRGLAPHCRAEPRIVLGRWRNTGTLALVVPLLRRRCVESSEIDYAFLGVTDYALPVIDREVQKISPARLASQFRQAIGRYDRLDVRPVPADGAGAWRLLLQREPVMLGFGAHHATRDAPKVPDPALARKIKRLETQGSLSLQVAEGDAIRASLEAARHFRIGRFPDDPMQSEASFEFYVEVAARGARSGLARTYVLRCGAELVAVLFGVIHGRRFHYLVLGCDYPRFGRYSPGMIMFARTMRHWFDNSGEVFDFTIGDEAFKTALGCVRTPMYHFLEALQESAVETRLMAAGNA